LLARRPLSAGELFRGRSTWTTGPRMSAAPGSRRSGASPTRTGTRPPSWRAARSRPRWGNRRPRARAFKQEIADLASRGLLPPLMKDWSDTLCELGNDSAHPKPWAAADGPEGR